MASALLATAFAAVLSVAAAPTPAQPASRTHAGPIADPISPLAFGAVCNGALANAAADTAAINAALAYAGTLGGGGAVVKSPNGKCEINATLVIPVGVTLTGPAAFWSNGLAAAAANLNPMIQLNGGGAGVVNMFINASAAGENISGVVIQTNGAQNNVRLRDIDISGACGGVDLSGSYYTVDNVSVNTRNVSGGSGCYGIQFGRHNAFGNSVDGHVNNLVVVSTTLAATAADWCVKLNDAGGLYMHGAEAYGCKVGTYWYPSVSAGTGQNQEIDFVSIDNSVLGDTSTSYGFYVDTTNPGNKIRYNNLDSDWASSSETGNILVKNDGGGIVQGLKFSQLRALGFAGPPSFNVQPVNNVEIAAGSEIAITNGSIICGYVHDGVLLGTGVSYVTISQTKIGGGCAAGAEQGRAALAFAGDNSHIIVTSNDLTVAAGAPTSGAPIGDSMVRDNIGLGATPTIAAGAAISLPDLGDLFYISGGTTVTHISGGWSRRHVTLVAQNPRIQFDPGGGGPSAICNHVNSTSPDAVFTADYDPTGQCWRMK